MILSTKQVGWYVLLYFAIEVALVAIALTFIPDTTIHLTRPAFELITQATAPICELMLLAATFVFVVRNNWNEEEE